MRLEEFLLFYQNNLQKKKGIKMRNLIGNVFATRKGIIISGAIIGVLAAVLQKLGNPGNMGICVACFTRDIAGALGLHRAAVVQYMRPEIIGLIIGATIASFSFGEFKSRSGSSPIFKFFLGAFAVVGALVFLGCPWRTLLRIAGGDLNAWIGLAGLVAGIFIGTTIFSMGFNPGVAKKTHKVLGLLFPFATFALLIGMFLMPQIAGEEKSGLFYYSLKGPGAMHAPLIASVLIGLVVGFIVQRSRFCTIGGFRDLILFKQMHLLYGAIAFIIVVLIANLCFGQFKLGFENQPAAHTVAIWNFLGMVLAGLCFTLGGGCPGRQCVLAGEGDGDSAVFVIGMLFGAAIAHNWGLAATPKGVGINGQIAVVAGIITVMVIGYFMRDRD